MYRVEWNTGDDQWDNFPEVEHYNTLEEVVDVLNLNERQLKELEEEGCIYDDTYTEWFVEIE